MKFKAGASRFKIPLWSLHYWRKIGLLSSLKQLSFGDLVRARFISYCRSCGISLQELSRAARSIPAWQQQLTVYADHILALREGEILLSPQDGQLFLPFQQEREKRAKDPIVLTRERKDLRKAAIIAGLEEEYKSHLQTEDTERMERALKKIIQLDSAHFKAWLELGNIYYSRQQLSKACHAYKKILETSPAYPEALYNLANVHFQEKRYAAAIRSFQKCIQADPSFVEAYYNLGLLLYHLKYYSSAIVLLEGYIQLDPQSSWAEQAAQIVEEAYAKEGASSKQAKPFLFNV